MMNAFLGYEFDDGVVVLTMNRPETGNAVSDPDAMLDIVTACSRINSDHAVRAVILTGSGRCFSSGGNIKTMREKVGRGLGEPVQTRFAYRDGIQQLTLALHGLEVPTIAAVNGYAIGAGNDLACMCDMRICNKEAVFAASFIKLGLLPGDGGAWLLPRIIGGSRASQMLFTGKTIDAQQALAYGLVSSVVDNEQLMPTAMALARDIAAHPSHALRMTKRLLREGEHTRLDTLLEMSAALQALAHHTQAHEEALSRLIAAQESRARAF